MNRDHIQILIFLVLFSAVFILKGRYDASCKHHSQILEYCKKIGYKRSVIGKQQYKGRSGYYYELFLESKDKNEAQYTTLDSTEFQIISIGDTLQKKMNSDTLYLIKKDTTIIMKYSCYDYPAYF